MTDEALRPFGELRRALEAALVTALVFAALFLPPAQLSDPAWRISTELFFLDDGEASSPPGETADWAPLASSRLAPGGRTGWLRWENAPAPDFDGPLALWLAGPFSAEVWWNGERIGAKGEAGSDRASERAGPIDALIALPQGAVRERNQLLIRYSSHRAYYRPAAVLQGVYLTPYRPDARRSMRYYAPLILLSGGLAALAGLFIYFARARQDPRAYWLAAALTGLLFAGAAEASRAWINYPYDWHQPRQAAVLIGFAVFGGGLLAYALQRWPAGPALMRPTAGLAGALWLLVAILATGYDAKSSGAFLILALTALAWCAWRVARGAYDALAFSPLLLALALYAWRWPADILDRGAYAFAAAFFGWALLRQAGWLVPRPAPAPAQQAPLIERLALQTGGGAVFAPLNDIARLKAAGNYTEVHRSNGDVVLDNRGLAALLEALPERFFRVHRSWAVDLDRAERLTSREGSRYSLILCDGSEVPVSREKVTELRARMGG